MNAKAEVFQNYLKEKNLQAFQVQEIEGDQQGTVVFRSHVLVEGQQLPTIVLLDNSVFVMIRVQVSPGARTAENELALLRLANEQNLTFKPFKLYIDGEGSLILDACIIKTGDNFDSLGDEIYGMFDILINFLNEKYRSLMKGIWGEEEAAKKKE